VEAVSAYPYQSTKHDASISAERRGDKVVVEIVRGEKKARRITMWAEDFEQMARDVLGRS